MKSAKVLIPILVVVLLVCMMALTFAWFAETMEEARLENIFRVGQAAQVVLSDDGGALIGANTTDSSALPKTERLIPTEIRTKLTLRNIISE